MLLLLLILIPLGFGVLSFFTPEKQAPLVALVSTLVTVVLAAMVYQISAEGSIARETELMYSQPWIPFLNANFSLRIVGGTQTLMVALTAIVFAVVFLSLWNKQPDKPARFYGLMLLTQAGLMGVFLANDALLFYLFWELALIPVYFLSSLYGGERRIPVTFKFFVYTFSGSLLLLVALLYIYSQTPVHSFSWDSFVATGNALPSETQFILFWLIFIAFAIKMPIFPFHTWQPDAYEQSATPVTIILSAVMVKMGLFAVLRWLLPVLQDASEHYKNVVILLSVISVVYASLLAMVQHNIKRLIAYSSIAHIGLMCASLFSGNTLGAQGASIQMFSHGINIMGLWLLVHILERQFKTQDLREMGGIAKVAPAFTIGLVLISLANIALPLTNGFIGEFIMFNGLFNTDSPYRIWFTVFAGLGVVLSAVYTLGMIQKVALGEVKQGTVFTDLSKNEWICIVLIGAMILYFGFYPKLLTQLITI
jgi:NADH-quinone oxidoreductase subunit M